jgi:hypothetical protein
MALPSYAHQSSTSTSARLLRSALLASLLAVVVVIPACSGDDDNGAGAGGAAGAGGSDAGDGGTCPAGGGAITGDAGPDNHCIDDEGGTIAQVVGACAAEGTPADDASVGEEPFTVRYNSEADDDDCKYHAKFENTCIAVNQDVTFTLTLTKKADGTAAAGGNPDSLEAYLFNDDTHISPSNNFTATETSQGVYTIGPVKFDVPGDWVVRFHYFHDCSDIPEDSPHGHIAFHVNVP